MKNIDLIITFFNSKLFDIILNYIITLFGAIGMYAFSHQKGILDVTDLIKKLFPKHSDTFYTWIDFIFIILFSSIVSWIVFKPQNTLQALMAGFGSTSAINTLISQGKKNDL